MEKIIFTILLFMYSSIHCQTGLYKIDSIVQKAIEKKVFNGTLLLAKDEKIIFDKSNGYADFEKGIPIDSTTQFQIASVSKQFTAFGIMVLKNENKLRYNDFVAKYLEKFPYPKITIRHLLQHTSGLPNFWNDIRPNLDTTKSNGNKELLAYLINSNLPLSFEPGTAWEYADIGYDLLASIIEKISGLSYQKFMSNKVFIPAGLSITEALMVTDIERIKSKKLARGYIQDSIKGNQLAHCVKKYVHYLGDFYGDGSVISTPRDLYKWSIVLDKYLVQDNLHYSEAYKPIIRNDGSVYETRPETSYGMGWGLSKNSTMGRFYYHSGGHPGFITNVYRYIDRNMVLIVCQNVENDSAFSSYLTKIREILPEIK